MELKWLEDFVALARNGTFSRAAAERHVTQPAFSRRIRALENWLGVTLFDRSVFPITLTEYGRSFMPHAQELIASATSVRQDFRLLSRSQSALVKIATLHTLSIGLVPRLVAPFLAQNPRSRVELLPSVQGVEAYFDALSSGLAHIAIAYAQQRPGDSPSEQWEQKEVAHDELLPVVSSGYVRRHGAPNLRAGKAAIPIVSYSELTFSRALVAPAIERLSARAREVAAAPLAESLKSLAMLDLGVAWLPRSSVAAELASGALRALDGEEFRLACHIHAWRSSALRHDLVDELWRSLPEICAGEPAPESRRKP